jgi:type IV pilus assembly protein PilQ
MPKNGNVVLITPREELAVKEKQQLLSRCSRSTISSAADRDVPAQHSEADAVKALISDKEGKFLSKRGTAVVDARTNILFVRIPRTAREVRRLIRQIDVTVRQVVIESRIVIADDKFGRQLGVRFGMQTGFTLNRRYAAASAAASIRSRSSAPAAGRRPRETRTQTPFELASGLAAPATRCAAANVNLPVVNPAGQLALTLINLGSGNLINLELSALEADSRGKVVSSPRVVTADNQKASIEQGTEIRT